MGRIFSSNFLLGLNFHFLNTVHPAPIRATTAATTMMMINVVLLSPAIFSGSSLAAAAEADAEAEAVTRTTVELREAVTTVVRTDRAAEVGEVEATSDSEDEDATAATTGSADDVSG